MLTGEVEHIPDGSVDEMPAYVSRLVTDYANFSLASAPMLWQGQGIGTIDIVRSPPRPFSDKEVSLLKTFADQAVVAIQNAKLFNETKVALERQTATAEILAVIADSPEDVQPVLDAIVESAKRLIGGFSATVFRVFDGMVHLAAFTATDEAGAAALRANFPAPLSSFYGFEPLRSGRVIQVEDTETDPQITGEWRKLARQRHYRANVNVPMLRDGVPIGMISVTRTEPGPFAPHHVDLLQSFAAQAVIAIENVRLFNETKEALEQQTATAEILRVISGSVTDTQPVFDAIVQSCRRLFAGKAVALAMPRGDMIESVAFASDGEDRRRADLEPWPLDHGSGGRRASSTRADRRGRHGRRPRRAFRACRNWRSHWATTRRSSCPCCARARPWAAWRSCARPQASSMPRSVRWRRLCRPGRDRDRERASVQ